jgi:uncharacterized HAD superfamily protein
MSEKKKKKAVVLDLDDVTFDFLGTLIHLYNEENGTCLTEHDLVRWDFDGIEMKDARGNITKGADIRKFFEEVEQHGLYAFTPVFPHAKQAIDMLHEWGYKIIFLTARKDQYKKITELSLKMGHVKFDKIIHNWDKCKVIEELKEKYEVVAFADDKYSTVQAVKKLCNLPCQFVVTKAHNVGIEPEEGIIRVTNLLEIVRYL